MYFLQKTLFSFEEWLEIEISERAPLFFKEIDLRPYLTELISFSPQGAPGHNKEAMLRALLIGFLEGIDTFTGLCYRLNSDFRLRYYCGFRLTQKVPSVSSFSRLFKQIVEKNLAERLFYDLVECCRKEGIIIGENIAIDSSAIDAFEKKQPKSSSQETGNATWGAKFDSFGNKITWFGYKLHLAVDTESELPVALEVTPANVNDGEAGPSLVETVHDQAPGRINYIMEDAGYDQLKNYEVAHQIGAQAIIPLNHRNEKQPPSGFSFNGTPQCSMGYDMVYWGKDGHFLKFRCPHVLGKVDCPFGSAWCSDSNYGLVVKIDSTDDLRRFSLPHRGTQAWNELYNQRTSSERCFSRLKENLTVNDLHLGGIKKVKSYAFLNAVALLASALAVKRTQKEKSQHQVA